MTSGVSQDDWREAEGCIGGSTSLPADDEVELLLNVTYEYKTARAAA